jgi:outer membrane protein TolC
MIKFIFENFQFIIKMTRPYKQKKSASILLILLFTTIFFQHKILAQNDAIRTLTLQDAIEIARQQSPDALMAKHRFRAEYWSYKSFKASYLPSLTLFGYVPDFDRSVRTIETVEGSVFSAQTQNTLYAGLSVEQRIGLTGGTVSLNSNLTRLDNITDSTNYTQYSTSLLNLTYRQPIFQYNAYRWERKIEPMKYEEAKKRYLENMESVAATTTNYFFNLLLAQIEERIARVNQANYDTLYKIAQGRYNLGKIAENELLQLELNYLRANSTVQDAQLNLENELFRFKSFLRIKEDTNIELIIPDDITPFKVNTVEAIEHAKYNNSEALSFTRQLIEAESQVAQAKQDGRFDAELFAVYGLTNNSEYVDQLTNNPLDQQQLRLGVTLPILDWGVARGRIKMAESNQEIVRTTVEQDQIDFDQEVFLLVTRFNLQYNQVTIAARADTVAQKGYEVTKARYLIGKITITDLNIAQTESDRSKSSYINTLRTYWRNYYDLRRLTLYDFEHKSFIEVDHSELL